MNLTTAQIKKLRKVFIEDLEDSDYYYILENKIIKKLPAYRKWKWEKWQDYGMYDQWAQKLIEQANRQIRKQFVG